jgi:hypothetical protein
MEKITDTKERLLVKRFIHDLLRCEHIKKCQGLHLGIKSCRIAPASAHEKSGGRLHRDAGSQRNAFIPESAAARCAPLSCGVPGT